jgi:mitochondrial fission protein ELM1
MVALWVKQQSAGQTRIVLFGKPSSQVEDYDLIVSSSEILMPPLSNIISIDYPLMRVDRQAIENAAKAWLPRLLKQPRPLIAIMIGGPTKPYVYNQRTAQQIITIARQITDQQHGTAYLVTSRRTPDSLLQRLSEQLPSACTLYSWKSTSADNPYKALLGSADGFIVTEDSISMIIEVAKLGKPLAIFPLSTGRLGWLDSHRRRLTGLLFSSTSETLADKVRIGFALCLYKLGLVRQVRDYSAFQNKLIAQGHAVKIDQPLVTPNKPLNDDLSSVVDAIVRFVNNED